MWKALTKLIEKWACGHQWEKLTGASYSAKGYDKPVSLTEVYTCKNCGKIKKIEL